MDPTKPFDYVAELAELSAGNFRKQARIEELEAELDRMKARLDWIVLKFHWTSEQMHLGAYARLMRRCEGTVKMDNQRAIQLLQAHIDAEDMPLFSQAAAMGIRAIERVAALEAELATANLQADQYLRALVEIGHKLSIENAEQFHTAAYAQGRIIDAIIERRVETEKELVEARKELARQIACREDSDRKVMEADDALNRSALELAEARKDSELLDSLGRLAEENSIGGLLIHHQHSGKVQWTGAGLGLSRRTLREAIKAIGAAGEPKS